MKAIKKLDSYLITRYGKSKVTDAELDEIYRTIDILMTNKCWSFLNDFFMDMTPRIWRTDIDVLLAYATASLPAKSKLPARERFLSLCQAIHHYPELWKGLE